MTPQTTAKRHTESCALAMQEMADDLDDLRSYVNFLPDLDMYIKLLAGRLRKESQL